MRAITHSVRPGVRAECRMEGDTFEMEDQRNWSDASYKTYVRPLALPWPYMLPVRGSLPAEGTSRRSRALLRRAVARQRRCETQSAIELGEVGPEAARDRRRHLSRAMWRRRWRIFALLRQLAPQRLLFHFDPTRRSRARCAPRLCRSRRRVSGPGDARMRRALPARSRCWNSPRRPGRSVMPG